VPEIADRLARRTLELIDIPSVSGNEAAILSHLGALAAASSLDVAGESEGALLMLPSRRRPEATLVLLAGHVDTVPVPDGHRGLVEDGWVSGRGASDMKGALAVMLEVASALGREPFGSDLDVGLVLFGREELPSTEDVLPALLERSGVARDAALAIVMEPTDNGIELGCLGNLNATVTVRGRAAHTARPWLGDNAVHAAIEVLGPLADLPPRDVDVDGLTFREVAAVTMIAGGSATNVVPDRVVAHVNLRYAPTHSPSDAEARLRELLADPRAEIRIVGNAPPAPAVGGHPLVARLRAAGNLGVGPKQAWTPVADFAAAGIDSVNFGPGDPQYAHADDERVSVDALVRSYDVLRRFLQRPPQGES
jgi:succinyl-diaminopimelate desuccinylase